MKNILMLIAAALISFASVAHAQNYYVCNSGDDTNNGLSESAPFKTFAKAMQTFNKMSGGDSILFCRGGTFDVSTATRLYNTKCSANAYCTIADYGDTSKQRPVIIADNVNAFNFEDGGNADADGGYIIKNLILKSTTHTQSGVRMFNDVNDVVLDNLYIDGFALGVYSSGANTPNPGANGINDRITLKNSVITNNSGQGWLGGGNDVVIENNQFIHNGSLALRDHNIYIGPPNHETVIKGVTIKGNTLYKSDMSDGMCQGVSLVVHGLVDDILIEGNTIKEDAGTASNFCWGIAVDPGYFSEEAFHNVVIRDNSLLNMGNIGIGCASCVNAQIENNKIVDEGQVLTVGVKVPDRQEDTVKSDNVTISNNQVILSSPKGYGISIGGVNPFSAISNSISQPQDTTVPCIEKTDANADTDTSSNICSLVNGISLIDSQTGSTVSGSDVSTVGSLTTDRSTATTTTGVGTTATDFSTRTSSTGSTSTDTTSSTTGSGTTTTATTDTAGSGTTATSTDRTTATTTTTGVGTTATDFTTRSTSTDRATATTTSTTLADVQTAATTDYSTVNATTCRAYSGTTCLFR